MAPNTPDADAIRLAIPPTPIQRPAQVGVQPSCITPAHNAGRNQVVSTLDGAAPNAEGNRSPPLSNTAMLHRMDGMMHIMMGQQRATSRTLDEIAELRTGQTRLEAGQTRLAAGQTRLESDVFALKTDQTEMKDTISALQRSVKKYERSRRVNSRLSSACFDSSSGESTITLSHREIILELCLTISSSFLLVAVENDSDESDSESVGSPRSCDLKLLTSDDQSEENDEESNVINESWKLDDEGQGVDGADDDQMESDDNNNSEDEDSFLEGYCHQCQDAQAQFYCTEKECRNYIGVGLF